jgi:hypothetical protein
MNGFSGSHGEIDSLYFQVSIYQCFGVSSIKEDRDTPIPNQELSFHRDLFHRTLHLMFEHVPYFLVLPELNH